MTIFRDNRLRVRKNNYIGVLGMLLLYSLEQQNCLKNQKTNQKSVKKCLNYAFFLERQEIHF